MEIHDKPTIKVLLSKSNSELITFLGSIYENSTWVAEELVGGNSDLHSSVETITQLASRMKAIVDRSSNEKKLNLLHAHPDLCEKVGKLENLSKDSQEEQTAAGLQSLTEKELEIFTSTNKEYRETFGFPFILAVRNSTKYTVLSALKGRVSNSYENEFITALQQVHKIAWMRLLSKIDTRDADGFLTCHVLDTAHGCPGTKPKVSLHINLA
jgi:2-oxo-4-hydroxy-4-carboxy-5-ureidoimidazoline decarboxylase